MGTTSRTGGLQGWISDWLIRIQAQARRMPRALTIMTVLLGLAVPVSGQDRYVAGDVVQNFSLINRATGQPVQLVDFEGKIVLLEWFAWWCPFCQAAAGQIGPQVVDYFAARGGNTHGVPVMHVAVNLQAGQESQTQDFVNAYGIDLVLNDFNRAVAGRFQPSGQPIFAVINGVAGSPSHKQWELVWTHLGYGELQTPVATFRTVINSVQAALGEPPEITSHPTSVTTPAGSSALLAVSAAGEGSVAYQWFKDGVAIAGAGAEAFALPSVAPSDAGDYFVQVSNEAGSSTSRLARLTVAEVSPGTIVNLSVRARAGDAGSPLIAGFVVDGGSREVLVRGVGPTLAKFGLDPAGLLADPAITAYAGPIPVAMNDDWSAGGVSALQEAFAAVGAFALDATSDDSALVVGFSGQSTVHVSGAGGGSGIVLVEVYDTGAAGAGRLVNVSARNIVGAGDDILVAGFVVSGNAPKRLLLRGIGPGLAPHGVEGVLEDPVLELHTTIDSSDWLFATNDDWATEPGVAPAAAAVGAFGVDAGSADAALVVTVPAGAYTAHVRGSAGTGGTALVEVYEIP